MQLQRLKPWKTKILAVILSASLLAFSAACGAESSSSGTQASNTGTKGRYMEEELTLPVKDSSPVALTEKDGKLRVLMPEGLFDSGDGGKTWNPVKEIGSQLTAIIQGKKALASAAFSKDGALVLAYQENPSEAELEASSMNQETKYLLVGADGSEQELTLDLPESKMAAQFSKYIAEQEKESSSSEEDSASSSPDTAGAGTADVEIAGGGAMAASGSAPQNALQQLSFLENGNLLGIDQDGSIHVIDPKTGAIQKTISAGDNGYYYDFCVAKDTLVARNYDSIELYDTNTWERKEKDQTLTDFLFPGSANSGSGENVAFFGTRGGSVSSVGIGNYQIFADPSEDSIYLCGENGIYRHVLGGSSMEQVVNGALNSLASPSLNVQKILKMSDSSFKAVTQQQEVGGSGLLGFTYDPNMSAVPEKELKAYAFTATPELRQAIAVYQKAHPDVYINLEIGMTGTDAVTVSDALRTLNTNIMAGKGPDVILLDGMPVENYIEKGLLTDISDLVQEVSSSDGLFDNIIAAYQKDGKHYAVPTRFSLPLQDAKTGIVSAMKDLSSIADTAEKLRKENPELDSITGFLEPDLLLDAFFDVCSPAWNGEGGTLEEGTLTEFFTQMKRIYDTNLPKEENVDGVVSASAITMSSSSGGGVFMALDLATGRELLAFEKLNSLKSLSYLNSVNEAVGGSYQLQAGQSENVYLPVGVVGISAKSAAPDLAKDFVKYLLSSEAQKVDQGLGLPINCKAFDELTAGGQDSGGGISMMTEDGKDSLTLNFKWPQQSEFDTLKKTVEGLTTPAPQDSTIREAVLTEGSRFLSGETTLESTVESILKKVNLYLSE